MFFVHISLVNTVFTVLTKNELRLIMAGLGSFFHDKTRFFYCKDAEIASGTLVVIFVNFLSDADARRNCH